MKKILIITLFALFAFVPHAFAQDASSHPGSDGPIWVDFLSLLHSQTTLAYNMRVAINEGPQALVHEHALALKDGIPLDPSKLQKPLPPPDQNAAPLYEQLTKLLHDKPLGLPAYADKGMSASFTYTPEQIAAVRKILADRQDVMTLIHQAANKPQCVFICDWRLGLAMLLPLEFHDLRQISALLEIESYLLALDGHYSEAILNQALGFRLAEHVASTPGEISSLFGSFCESNALSGMQSILVLAGPNAEVDTQVQEVITASAPHLSLYDTLLDEPALFGTLFDKMRQVGPASVLSVLSADDSLDINITKPVKPSSLAAKNLALKIMDAWQAYYLQQMRYLIDASRKSPQERYAIFSHVDKENVITPNVAVFPKLLFHAIMSNCTNHNLNDCFYHTKWVLTQAAAAVLAEKAKIGTFPEQLPGSFTDPYNGNPLSYRREGNNGFVIYSTGADGKFNGGKPGDKPQHYHDFFRYPPPAPVPADMEK